MAPIIRKVVIRNVGVLKAFDTPNAPKLAPLTTIYARNGRGKSTFSAILNASSTGDADAVIGRRTLANGSSDPEVTLVLEPGSPIRFANGRWTTKETPIEVFDSNFISENLFAGEAIDLEHDRGLFGIILGREGVRLVEKQDFFNTAAKRAAAELKEAEQALKEDLPTDMSREEFLASSPSVEIDNEIIRSQKELKAIQQSARLLQLRKLEKIPVPILDERIQETLLRTVHSIDSTVRDQLAAHFTKFQLGKKGEAWIRFGQEHIHDDSCPFCGKSNVDELGLVSLYSQIFGEAYQSHFERIQQLSDSVTLTIGPDAQAKIANTVATNSDAILAWSEFYPVGPDTLPDATTLVADISEGYSMLKALLDSKRQTPLAAIVDDEKLNNAKALIVDAIARLETYNRAVIATENTMEETRARPQMSESQASARVENLIKRKRRSDSGVQARIQAVLREKRRDARAKNIRSQVQGRLKAANETAAAHYHMKVNEYLRDFGATFQISKITNSMAGNAGSVDYGLIVRGHPVTRGRGRAIVSQPNFKNSLSTGDKTTLAFAFFLAGLDRDVALGNKIIVFDDPLSSHDTHRERKTVDILRSLCGRCAQLIVLSHDAHFLRRVANRCSGIEQTSLQINYTGAEQWSHAEIADLDFLCQTDNSLLLNKLLSFYERREGHPTDVAPAVRKVLETHYRRSYSGYFGPKDNLGPIIQKIKNAGPGHPCESHVEILEACNVATMDEHHGDNVKIDANAPIDEDNLHGIVKDCLMLIHVLPKNDVLP